MVNRRSATLCLCVLMGTLWLQPQAGQQEGLAAPKKASNSPAKAPQAQAGPNYSQAYAAYLNRLRSKVYTGWNLPDGKNRVVITAVLQTDGTPGNVTVTSTPQNAKAEEAANDAFTKAQPFEALPSGTAPTAKLTITFDSTSTQHDSSSGMNMRMDPIIPAASGQ